MSAPSRSEVEAGRALTPEQLRSRKARNVAIGLLVGALVVLFYVITIAKLGSHVFNMFTDQ